MSLSGPVDRRPTPRRRPALTGAAIAGRGSDSWSLAVDRPRDLRRRRPPVRPAGAASSSRPRRAGPRSRAPPTSPRRASHRADRRRRPAPPTDRAAAPTTPGRRRPRRRPTAPPDLTRPPADTGTGRADRRRRAGRTTAEPSPADGDAVATETRPRRRGRPEPGAGGRQPAAVRPAGGRRRAAGGHRPSRVSSSAPAGRRVLRPGGRLPDLHCRADRPDHRDQRSGDRRRRGGDRTELGWAVGAAVLAGLRLGGRLGQALRHDDVDRGAGPHLVARRRVRADHLARRDLRC